MNKKCSFSQLFYTALIIALVFSVAGCNSKAPANYNDAGNSNAFTIENDSIQLKIDSRNGCFTITEKISGQVWNPDPWENAAALLTLKDSEGAKQTVNLSKSKSIRVTKEDSGTIVTRFVNPVFNNGEVAKNVEINCRIEMAANNAQISFEVNKTISEKYKLISLRYPARHFHLKTDVDKGAAVIPQKQGVICPSYIFPMNASSFCQWDDATYDRRSVGSLQIYGNSTGLSMPWWGTYNEKSAVVGILDSASAKTETRMEFNINNNGQYLFNSKGEISPWERIVFLDPVWPLNVPEMKKKITYHFIPGGDYVDMAKIYRKEAIDKGYFLSLKEKAAKNPNVDKLAGAVYLGVYGGYPHYVNMPGQAFNFERLQEIIKVTHNKLKVENAFVHAWGTFSNYPPNCWPISEELGGVEKLKEAVDLTKEYGYLYSSYHAYTPLLEHDPNFSTELMGRDDEGKLIRAGSRWARVASKHYKSLASENIEKEIASLDLEADITDIAFVFTPDSGSIELAKYLRSLNLVMGTEHGQEHWIPYFDMFEGMTYYEGTVFGIPLSTISHKAPLWNLVYHDAITNFGKIQDPDNETSLNGDFRIKSLRNILFGAGSLIFFSPYEFEGTQNMIKMADKVVSPVHRETFFAELLEHEFLSTDFQVQRSRFSNGTEVIANLNATPQKIEDGTIIPGFGYKVKRENGEILSGKFEFSVNLD